MPWGVIEGYSAFKGTIIALITAAIGTSFLQSLIVAITSASLSAIGMIIAARMAAQETRRNREEIKGLRKDVNKSDV